MPTIKDIEKKIRQSHVLYVAAHKGPKTDWKANYQKYLDFCQQVTHYKHPNLDSAIARVKWDGKAMCAKCYCQPGQYHAVGCSQEMVNGKQAISYVEIDG